MLNLQIYPSLKSFQRKNFIQQKKIQLDIPQLLLIQQQTDLINQMVKMPGFSQNFKKYNHETMQLSVSTIQNSRQLGYSQSATSLCQQQFITFNQSSLEEALKQIKKYCSWSTYSFVREKFRATDQNRIQIRLEKQMKYTQELMRRCLKLSHQVQQFKTKLQAANEKIKSDDRKRLAKDQATNLEKSQLFLKWQKSMLHKQKLQMETKKHLNKQFSMLSQQKQLNQNLREQIINVLQKFEYSKYSKNDIIPLTEQIKQILQNQRLLSKGQHEYFLNMQKQLQCLFQDLKNTIGFSK